MTIPRGFTRCDECKDGWQDCGTGTYDHSCPSCSGSGLLPTEKLREEARATLGRFIVDISDRTTALARDRATDAVLRKVAEHIARKKE